MTRRQECGFNLCGVLSRVLNGLITLSFDKYLFERSDPQSTSWWLMIDIRKPKRLMSYLSPVGNRVSNPFIWIKCRLSGQQVHQIESTLQLRPPPLGSARVWCRVKKSRPTIHLPNWNGSRQVEIYWSLFMRRWMVQLRFVSVRDSWIIITSAEGRSQMVQWQWTASETGTCPGDILIWITSRQRVASTPRREPGKRQFHDLIEILFEIFFFLLPRPFQVTNAEQTWSVGRSSCF